MMEDNTNNTSFKQVQIQQLLKRFPNLELSYETIAHKKVFETNNIGLAIPNGKKFFAWFTFQNDKDVCFIMELNREKKIINIHNIDIKFDKSLSLGTIIYGTIIPQTLVSKNETSETIASHSASQNRLQKLNKENIENNNNIIDNNGFFLMEEIYYYKGLYLKNMTFGEKLGYIELLFMNNEISQTLSSHSSTSVFNALQPSATPNRLQEHEFTQLIFLLPYIWDIKTLPTSFPEFNASVPSSTPQIIQTITEQEILDEYDLLKSNIPYQVHHIQIRKLNKINPYLNIQLNTILTRMNQREKEKNISHSNSLNSIKKTQFIMDYNKPQYKYPTIFKITPDIQYDIYHLFAYGRNKESIYYNTAYIPNIEKSFFMNHLFRNIRENKNLDYIEESDDEDEFEIIAEDKYVHLNKIINMTCIFNQKFKRWVPIRVVENDAKIVHISKLVNEYNG